jgi:hypothetical protein
MLDEKASDLALPDKLDQLPATTSGSCIPIALKESKQAYYVHRVFATGPDTCLA